MGSVVAGGSGRRRRARRGRRTYTDAMPKCNEITGPLAGLFLSCAALAAAQTGAVGGEWPTYGGDLGHTRYAPSTR